MHWVAVVSYGCLVSQWGWTCRLNTVGADEGFQVFMLLLAIH